MTERSGTGFDPLTRHEAVGNIISAYKHLYARIWNDYTDCDEISYEMWESLTTLGVEHEEIVTVLQEQRMHP